MNFTVYFLNVLLLETSCHYLTKLWTGTGCGSVKLVTQKVRHQKPLSDFFGCYQIAPATC